MPGSLPENKKFPIVGLLQLIGGFVSTALAADLVIDETYGSLVKLDPGGANRNVTLPDGDGNSGDLIVIVNAADADEDLVVKDSDANTVATIEQNYVGLFVCAGGSTWTLICKLSQVYTPAA